MSTKQFSRRDFLKIVGTTSAGLALSACGIKPTEVPAPTSTLTVVPPTKTLTPTSTPIPTPTATSIPHTVRGYADALGIRFGVMAEAGGHQEARFNLIAEHFNQIAVSTIDWGVIRPHGLESYDFSIPDWYIRKFAVENNLTVMAMHLVWGNTEFLPGWLKNGSFTRDTLIEIMKDHIKTVVDRYQGQVRSWVVVNEASEPSIFWNRRIGSDYVEMAFQTARETDPNAILIYNDFGHETAMLPKANQVFELVRMLKEKGLVDAVGMQMHVLGQPNSYLDPRTPPTKEQLLEQINRYGELGLQVFITELDVGMSHLSGTQDEKLTRQAEIYGTVVEACLESSGVCNDINVWGVNDEDAWQEEASLLFLQHKPKLAYFTVLDVLKKYYDEKK